MTQFSPFILLQPFRGYRTTKKLRISTNTETSVLSMHCAGTQDATYATWSHLDHTCAYVVNMVLQKKKNRVNMVLNMNVWSKSFLPRNTKAKRFLLSQSCRNFFCRCYSSGERLCRRQAVQFGFSQDDIDQCELDNWGYSFKLLSNENISIEQSYDISCRYCWAWCCRWWVH